MFLNSTEMNLYFFMLKLYSQITGTSSLGQFERQSLKKKKKNPLYSHSGCKNKKAVFLPILNLSGPLQ